jgi:hypothetical protein
MPIQFIVTAAGRAALVNAKHDGTNAVTIAQVGVSGTPIVATPATANLPGEVKRIVTISGSAVAADTMHVIVRDESADVFTVRSIAFYLSDGTLFGAYGQAGVIAEKSAQAMLLLAVDVIFADIDAAMIQFGDANFLNPPATVETAGVVKLAADAEAEAMVNSLKALTPRGLGRVFTAANIINRLLSVDGAGSGLDADLLDGRHGSEFALLASAPYFTGTVSSGGGGNFTLGLVANTLRTADGPIGFVALIPGSVTSSGYMELRRAGGAREGFIGFGAAGSPIPMISETGAGWAMTGPLTINGNQVMHHGNDGSGSAFDADMVDGRHASEFALLTGASFSGPVACTMGLRAFPSTIPSSPTAATQLQVGEVSQNPAYRFSMGYWADTVSGQWSGVLNALANNLPAPLNIQPSGGPSVFGGSMSVVGAITQNGSQVMHHGNDGSGSGYDADMLDGRHASEFALLTGANFTGSVAAAGEITSNGGMVRSAAAAGPVYFLLRRAGQDKAYFATDDTDNVFINAYVGSLQLQIQGATRLALTSAGANVVGALQNNGSQVMHQGNDGSGSGYDADMVDGRHASEFALLASNPTFTGSLVAAGLRTADGPIGFVSMIAGGGSTTGYIEFRRAGGIREGFIGFGGPDGAIPMVSETGAGWAMSGGPLLVNGGQVIHLGNDGSGCLFDADMLDGQHGAYYANIPARLGYQPLNAAAYTTSDVLAKLVTVDGSGSGVDADLLDGRHAADFALLTDATRAGSNANGFWEKRPNGVIEQWGTLFGPFSEGQIAIAFPIQFADENSIVITANAVNSVASDKYDLSIQRVSRTVNGCIVFAQYSAAASSINQINGIDWRAIGRG